MQRFLVQKVGIGSLGKLVGTWFAILGLLGGVVASVVASVAIFDNNSSALLSILCSLLATVGLLVVCPLVWFLVGWLQGAVLAVVFNVVVSGSGGLSVHLEETKMDGTKLDGAKK